MISLLDINTSLVNKLRGALLGTPFEGTPIAPGDLSEIARPSLKVDFDSIKLENINANFKARALTVRVYFFATSLKKYKIENLQVQEIIENIFSKGVWINGYYIPINDINAEIVDTVLTVDFDIYITAFNDDETGDPMEDLDTDFKY
jgi:hypothetical protein